MTAITVATIRWHQPLRALFDDYLGVEVALESDIEPEDVSRPRPETQARSESSSVEETSERERDAQEIVGFQDLLTDEDVRVPIVSSSRDVFLDRDPIDVTRQELQFALVSIEISRDLVLAADALRRAQSIASTNRMNPSLVEFIEQALKEIEQLRSSNPESIQDRLDALSRSVVSLGSDDSEHVLVDPRDTSISVAAQPESKSFWAELRDSTNHIYRVRRIDASTPKTQVKTGAQLRLLMFLERARSDLDMYDFESYRESLREAIASIDSLNPKNEEGLSSIRYELLELEGLEFKSPKGAIRNALLELSNATVTSTVDPIGLDL